MDAITVKVNLLDEIRVNAEGLDEITIYVNNYSPEISNLTTSLESHLNEKVNPHATDAVQEFADTAITELKSESEGGIVPDDDYNAFKSFFTTLIDKSVKSFIHGLIGWVRSLSERVGLLEDSYLLRYVVPVDCAFFELTTDKYGRPFNFQEGEEIEISFRIKPFPGGFNSRINMRVNGIETANYNWENMYGLTYIATAGTNYYGQSTVLKLKIIVGELNGYMMTMPFTGENTLVSTQAYGISSQGLNLSAINSIKLWSQVTQLPAGLVILIKKL